MVLEYMYRCFACAHHRAYEHVCELNDISVLLCGFTLNDSFWLQRDVDELGIYFQFPVFLALVSVSTHNFREFHVEIRDTVSYQDESALL